MLLGNPVRILDSCVMKLDLVTHACHMERGFDIVQTFVDSQSSAVLQLEHPTGVLAVAKNKHLRESPMCHGRVQN